jgi:hypothetical protein
VSRLAHHHDLSDGRRVEAGHAHSKEPVVLSRAGRPHCSSKGLHESLVLLVILT